MTVFTSIINRDEQASKAESARGMHHAGYWAFVLVKMLLVGDQKTIPRAKEYNTATGSYTFTFSDLVTGKKYDLQIKPSEES